jgi:hypothetical protein
MLIAIRKMLVWGPAVASVASTVLLASDGNGLLSIGGERPRARTEAIDPSRMQRGHAWPAAPPRGRLAAGSAAEAR